MTNRTQRFYRAALWLGLFITGTLTALFTYQAHAAPPYDVKVTLTAPTTGGAVSSYELRVNGQAKGALVVGVNNFPALLTADGTYTFVARATNAAGFTDSDPVTQTVTSLALPGKPGVQVQITCSPCVITPGP